MTLSPMTSTRSWREGFFPSLWSVPRTVPFGRIQIVKKGNRILDYRQEPRHGIRATFDVAFFLFGIVGVIGLLAILLVATVLQFGRLP